MTSVTLQFPQGVFSTRCRSPEQSARELRLAPAVHWYEHGEVSQEKAAEIAGLDRKQYQIASPQSPEIQMDLLEVQALAATGQSET